jgi:DNA invertase Pin-like site-specific DNA recombinase
MRVALYARVSTDVHEGRGSIRSQVQTLREWALQQAHELIAEYVDDGYSGAQLDRPGLDAWHDNAERGLFRRMARHGVRVLFLDAPDLDNDPQVRLAVVDFVPERAPLLTAKP